MLTHLKSTVVAKVYDCYGNYSQLLIMGIMLRCITDRRGYPASEPASAYVNKLIVAISILP